MLGGKIGTPFFQNYFRQMYFSREDGLRICKIQTYFPELCLKLKEAGIDTRIDSFNVKWSPVDTATSRSEITSVEFKIHIVNTDWSYMVHINPDGMFTFIYYKDILMIQRILFYFHLSPTFDDTLHKVIQAWKLETDVELFAEKKGEIIKDKYARTS